MVRSLPWALTPLMLSCMVTWSVGCTGGPAAFDVVPIDGAADSATDTASPDVASDAPRDATPDAARADAATDVATAECTRDEDCDNHVFCDGVERCAANHCTAGTDPCDDGHSCTRDSCNETTRLCIALPDDSRCSDDDACNGAERCAPSDHDAIPATGCVPPTTTLLDCDDSNTCTTDLCDRAMGCVHAPRDTDGDMHIDRRCTVTGQPGDMPGDDCNDSDANVHPGAAEVCSDGIDNNCDGNVDVGDISTCRAGNDVCEAAAVLPGPGSYTFTTAGLLDDATIVCSPAMTGLADAFVQFTLTEAHDVSLRTDTMDGAASIALVEECGGLQLRCSTGSGLAGPVITYHALPAGTYRAIIETGLTPQPFLLTYTVGDPTTAAPGDLCDSRAIELNDGMPHTLTLAPLQDDYSVSCHRFDALNPITPDAVFQLTLANDSDVFLTGSSVSGNTFLSLRSAPCEDTRTQLQCATNVVGISPTATMVQRHMPAGTYYVVAESTDISPTPAVTVQATITTPPAPSPIGEACPANTSDPSIDINDGAPHIIPLRNYSDDYVLGCRGAVTGASARDAVVRLSLAVTSDVRITASAPIGGTTVALRGGVCADVSSEIRCVSPGTSGAGIVNARALPAGTYWVFLENSDISNPNVVVTAQITSPPAMPAIEDACPPSASDPVVDISDGTPHYARLEPLADDYAIGCRVGAVTPYNAQDAVFRLVVDADSDVDITAARASSSGGSTFVSIRRGACANTAPELRCASGTTALASVKTVAAGTYWVVVENGDTVADDVVVTATVRPAAARVPGDFCPGVPVTIDSSPTVLPRSGFVTGDDVGTMCGGGSPSQNVDGFFNFSIPDTRDVFLTAVPTRTGTGSGSISLQVSSTCDGTRSGSVPVCSQSSNTAAPPPTGTTQIARGLTAGTYYAIVDATASAAISEYSLQVATAPAGGPPGTYALSSPGGVSFIDACTLPGATVVLQNVTSGGLAQIARTAVPFPLRVYGLDLDPSRVSSFSVSTYGWLSFLPASAFTNGTMMGFGSALAPNFVLAPYSRTLRTGAGGICYGVTGTAPNRQFVVEWNDVTFAGSLPAAHLTFEIIVNEATGTANNVFDVVYQTMSGEAGGSAGIESETGLVFTQDLGPFGPTPRVVRYSN